jgi:CheY-like chemotaxis protein
MARFGRDRLQPRCKLPNERNICAECAADRWVPCREPAKKRDVVVAKAPGKQHILVINDAQEVLEVIRDLLEDEGYQVTLHSTAIYDLDKINSIDPDLLILDHLMGDEEYGWQMVQKLKLNRQLSTLPIIVCTAAMKMVEELQGHLMAKGVTVVLKPFDIDDLLGAITRALANHGNVR